jgi:hypothetical protein
LSRVQKLICPEFYKGTGPLRKGRPFLTQCNGWPVITHRPDLARHLFKKIYWHKTDNNFDKLFSWNTAMSTQGVLPMAAFILVVAETT